MSPEAQARDFLSRQQAPYSTEGVFEAAVAALAELLRQVVHAERQACADIADRASRLYGSHSAEEIAKAILARSAEE